MYIPHYQGLRYRISRSDMSLFFLAGWLTAVLVSLLGCILNVVGFLLQKIAQEDRDSDTWPKLGDVIFSPMWILGFTLAVVAPLPGNVIAYACAPMSLTAPLCGVTVILNTAIAPRCLGEKLQPWPDFMAMALICAGCILSTTTGAHEDNVKNLTLHDMLRLIFDPVFIVAFLIFGSSVIATILYELRNAEQINKAALTNPNNPPMHHVVLPAWAAAGCGGITNIFLKGFSKMVESQQPATHLIACIVLGVIPFASLQINFLNRGLRLYLLTIFFPTYNAMLLLNNTICGALFYHEYNQVIKSAGRTTLFALGVVSVVVGISMFRYRKAVPEDNEVPSEHSKL